jgi:hypothetical protein
MSMETHVFFRGRLPGKAALSRAMKELGFPFSIPGATGSLERQSGFMPMKFRGEETGVELDLYGDHDAVEEFADAGVDRSFERRASFRWGGDFQEAVAGMCAAAALAKLVDGVVFDEAENRLLTVDRAIEVARNNLQDLPKPRKARSPRGPTVLKRILAPLFAKRDDLVLVDRLLLIRPVRHLIRGALLRWHERGTWCGVAPYIRPLYQPSELFLEDAVMSAAVDDPDFPPMLFDRLATKILGPVGEIASIEDFIASSWGKRLWPTALLPSILLARGIEAAEAYRAPFEACEGDVLAQAKARLSATDRRDRFAKSMRRLEVKSAEEAIAATKKWAAFLAGGNAAVFANYREWEAKVAKGFKIQDAWEPTPFPVELPAATRHSGSADPVFSPKPWLEFPDTWRQKPPDKPGEVRFARDWWHVNDPVTLLHPITREQAEKRHRDLEYYVLATRLPQRQLMILSYSVFDRETKWPTVRYYLWIYGARGRHMIVDFWERHDAPGALEMRSIDIRGDKAWHSSLNFRDGQKLIHDYRPAEKSYECRKMTARDRSAYIFRLPRFGEFELLWQRISTYLSKEGYRTFA